MARAVSASPLQFSSPSTICTVHKLRPNSLRIAASLDGSAPLLRAAKYTVDKYIKSGMVIGLGSGHASGMAIQYLGQQLRVGALEDIVGIASSIASASEAAKVGIPLDAYTKSSQIDFAFDDADIIEEETLVAVIGRGSKVEDSIILEKNILTAAKKLVFMVTENKYKGELDGSVPILVQCLKWFDTAEEIEDLFLGDAEVWRRPSIGHSDPRGGDYPLITKEGHNVLDLIFTSPIPSLEEVAESLDNIRGVVDHGIVSKLPCIAVVASESEVRIVENTVNSAVARPAM